MRRESCERTVMLVAEDDDTMLTLLILFSSLPSPLQDGCKEIPNSLGY